MENLILSKNGMYLINNESIYSVAVQKSRPINELTLTEWVDIFKENTFFSIKNHLVEISELAAFHRRATYQLMESLSYDLKYTLMFEYESKFGNKLLIENSILIESWFNDAWDWVKNNATNLGEFGVKTWKDLISCVTSGQCSPLFEDFREMLYSPVGIGIETFLSVSGFGSIAPIIAWGIMLCYDSYLLSSGSEGFSWLNLIFDILGVGFGMMAKTARASFGGASAVARSAGKSLPEVVSDGMKNPQTVAFFKKLYELGKTGLNKIMGVVRQAGQFISEKLGLKWIGQALDGVSLQIAKILGTIGVTSKGGISSIQKGVKQGIKQASIASAIPYGIKKVGSIFNNREDGLINLLNNKEGTLVDGVDY